MILGVAPALTGGCDSDQQVQGRQILAKVTQLLRNASVYAQSECEARPDAVSLSAIQGTGPRSRFEGRVLWTEGQVTAVLDAPGQLRGVFLGAEGAGLFVHWGKLRRRLEVGERVQVRGRVVERKGMTQLVASALARCSPGAFRAPEPSPPPEFGGLESFEGRHVRWQGPWEVVDTSLFAPFGTLGLRHGGGLMLRVDDRSRRRYRPELATWERLCSAGPPWVGSTLEGIEGLLTEEYGAYQLRALRAPRWAASPPPPVPARGAAQARLVFLNAYNLFGPKGPRGAKSAWGRRLQTRKLAAQLSALAPDLAVLAEVERQDRGALAALAEALRQAMPETVKVIAPVERGDAIGFAALQFGERVRVQAADRCAHAKDSGRAPRRLTLAFGARTLELVATHHKSRGRCPKGAGADGDRGFGCWNKKRVRQSEALVACVAEAPEVLVLGDFNALPHEPPVTTLQAAGFADLAHSLPRSERYTYVYQGRRQQLDHALYRGASEAPRLAIWHINSDAPVALAYKHAEKLRAKLVAGSREARCWQALWARREGAVALGRASDHDPLVVDLP